LAELFAFNSARSWPIESWHSLAALAGSCAAGRCRARCTPKMRGRCVFADVTNKPQVEDVLLDSSRGLKGSASVPFGQASVGARHAGGAGSLRAPVTGGGCASARGRYSPLGDARMAATAPAKSAQLQASYPTTHRQACYSAVHNQPSAPRTARGVRPSPLKAVPVGPTAVVATPCIAAPPKVHLKQLMQGAAAAATMARCMERGTPRGVLQEVLQEGCAVQIAGSEFDGNQQGPQVVKELSDKWTAAVGKESEKILESMRKLALGIKDAANADESNEDCYHAASSAESGYARGALSAREGEPESACESSSSSSSGACGHCMFCGSLTHSSLDCSKLSGMNSGTMPTQLAEGYHGLQSADCHRGFDCSDGCRETQLNPASSARLLGCASAGTSARLEDGDGFEICDQHTLAPCCTGEDSGRRCQQERRIDPELDNRAVTFDEMCQGLVRHQLTFKQLEEHRGSLKPKVVRVHVVGAISGESICWLEAEALWTVASLKRALENQRGIKFHTQQLLLDGDILEDNVRLWMTRQSLGRQGECDIEEYLEVSLVQDEEAFLRGKMSSVAMHYEILRQQPHGYCPEDQIDLVLGELVDSFLHSCHQESQRHLPSAADLHARLSSGQRESILVWLVQACDIMRFHEAVLYSTVLTLDRYCAASQEPLPMDRMQKVLMAVICTVLKTCAVADEICMPLRDLLVHLCRRQVLFEDILAMEHQVLKALRFQVSTPSALDFLDALCVPLLAGESPEGSPIRCLANFLLQLSLFNAPLHYRRPHAILAAGAIYVAICSFQAARVWLGSLLNDVATACPDITDVCSQVVACAGELHTMWISFASVPGTQVPCVLHKFASRRLHEAVLLSPTTTGLLNPAVVASLA